MKNYTIIQADVERDKEIILSILQRNLVGRFAWGNSYDSQHYDFSFKQSPHGNALCWLVKFEPTNSFVGITSLAPRKLLINEKPIYSGIVGDVAVDKDHRGFGPALKLQREVLSKANDFGYIFNYAAPNKFGRPVLSRVGYKEIGEFKLYVKLLKTVTVPKRFLRFLPRYLQSNIPLKIIDFFIGIVSKEKRVKDKFGYSIEMPDLFDERFDVLWEKASKEFNIIGERSSKFLNWKHKQSYFLRDYKIFCLLDDEKELVGYIVYSVEDNTCYVADMLFLPSDNSIDLLLAKFILYLRAKETGAIFISYMGNSFIKNKLKEFNFFPKDDDEIIMLYVANLPNESYLLDENNWYFFAGDREH